MGVLDPALGARDVPDQEVGLGLELGITVDVEVGTGDVSLVGTTVVTLGATVDVVGEDKVGAALLVKGAVLGCTLGALVPELVVVDAGVALPLVGGVALGAPVEAGAPVGVEILDGMDELGVPLVTALDGEMLGILVSPAEGGALVGAGCVADGVTLGTHVVLLGDGATG